MMVQFRGQKRGGARGRGRGLVRRDGRPDDLSRGRRAPGAHEHARTRATWSRSSPAPPSSSCGRWPHASASSTCCTPGSRSRTAVFTGRVVEPICFEEGKIYWLQQFIEEQGVDLAKSWFYTDSITDRPLLDIVGHPVAVNPDPLLYREAGAHAKCPYDRQSRQDADRTEDRRRGADRDVLGAAQHGVQRVATGAGPQHAEGRDASPQGAGDRTDEQRAESQVRERVRAVCVEHQRRDDSPDLATADAGRIGRARWPEEFPAGGACRDVGSRDEQRRQ